MNLGNVVIGSSLEALLFAYYGKYKILYCKNEQPHQLDTMEDFGLGTSTLEAWRKHALLLSLAGYVPFENRIKHIRYVDENTIIVITHEDSSVTVKFDKLYVYDDTNFLDLPISLKKTTDNVRIVDWFYTGKNCRTKIEYVEQEEKFMNQIYFYEDESKRKTKRRDACVVTYCKRKDVEKYQKHIVKIKLESIMEELEIKNIDLDHMHRDLTDYGKNIYEDFDNVEFKYDEAKFLFEINQRHVKIDYMKYLKMKLGIQ